MREAVSVGCDGWIHSVAIRLGKDNVRTARMGRDQNRDNRCRVALSVEVLEVQSIVPDLVDVVSPERFGADFEFDHKENRSGNQYRVDTAPDARDDELEKDCSFQI